MALLHFILASWIGNRCKQRDALLFRGGHTTLLVSSRNPASTAMFRGFSFPHDAIERANVRCRRARPAVHTVRCKAEAAHARQSRERRTSRVQLLC